LAFSSCTTTSASQHSLPCCADDLLLLRRSYVHFCACGKQLDSRFESLGAKRFADRFDVHKEDLPAIDKWLSGVTAELQALQLQTFQDTGGVHEPLLGAVQLVILPAQKPGKLIQSIFYVFVTACPCEAADMAFLPIYQSYIVSSQSFNCILTMQAIAQAVKCRFAACQNKLCMSPSHTFLCQTAIYSMPKTPCFVG